MARAHYRAESGGIAMKNIRVLLLVPAAVLAAACGRDASKTDDALKNDLALASQAQPYNAQQVTSPAEMGYAYNPYTGQFQPIPAAQPQVQRVAARPTTVRRASTARRTSSSSGTRVVYEPAPAPAEPVRHTKRDAVIGGVAGAVIGATTSRDKVKGAIIGGAAGAVLGGIIGHTVDVQKP
jgi:hypothetical protein